eukprot:763153-Hanusia_phi.AAC.6
MLGVETGQISQISCRARKAGVLRILLACPHLRSTPQKKARLGQADGLQAIYRTVQVCQETYRSEVEPTQPSTTRPVGEIASLSNGMYFQVFYTAKIIPPNDERREVICNLCDSCGSCRLDPFDVSPLCNSSSLSYPVSSFGHIAMSALPRPLLTPATGSHSPKRILEARLDSQRSRRKSPNLFTDQKHRALSAGDAREPSKVDQREDEGTRGLGDRNRESRERADMGRESDEIRAMLHAESAQKVSVCTYWADPDSEAAARARRTEAKRPDGSGEGR